MQPTRQEMLSAIEHKIARTGGGTGPGETGYYLPITFEETLKYFRGISQKPIAFKWWDFGDTLDKQSDDCISYIFSLLSHE